MESVQDTIFHIGMVILLLAILWAVFQYMKFYKTEHFVCPKCGYSWKPPVWKMILAVNAVEGKIIRCPSCGAKEYMEPVKDIK